MSAIEYDAHEHEPMLTEAERVVLLAHCKAEIGSVEEGTAQAAVLRMTIKALEA